MKVWPVAAALAPAYVAGRLRIGRNRIILWTNPAYAHFIQDASSYDYRVVVREYTFTRRGRTYTHTRVVIDGALAQRLARILTSPRRLSRAIHRYWHTFTAAWRIYRGRPPRHLRSKHTFLTSLRRSTSHVIVRELVHQLAMWYGIVPYMILHHGALTLYIENPNYYHPPRRKRLLDKLVIGWMRRE